MFIASFSRDSNSLSQWRAYGGGGIQVAIGFDRALLGAVATKYGYELKKCIYKEGDQELALKSIVESFDPDYLAN